MIAHHYPHLSGEQVLAELDRYRLDFFANRLGIGNDGRAVFRFTRRSDGRVWEFDLGGLDATEGGFYRRVLHELRTELSIKDGLVEWDE